ncbi:MULTISPECIES: adenylyltransferase/cytidyltransferase family protein [Streptococcus]|uniref:adenylyltransferase/cytidyltransferase family protein n=1 Tax=Streptococcus TaxID=1301 RepID=UPI0012DCF215|nr:MULTISPECIES: adenylyltransferase/cytidyltransferase family protein [Streptococcus]QHF55407.1 cytidyltransferase [Streptococcus sp. DAT741]
MQKSVAVVFGTFAPMHKGHLDLIERAKVACGRVYVVVSGYEGDRGDRIGMSLSQRLNCIQIQFEADSRVTVCALDETDLPPYPHGWKQWLNRLLNLLELTSMEQPIFYVSEEEYAQELENRGYQAACGPRKFGISATMIRENPKKYLEQIAPAFRSFFREKQAT